MAARIHTHTTADGAGVEVRAALPSSHVVDVHLEPQWSAQHAVDSFAAAMHGTPLQGRAYVEPPGHGHQVRLLGACMGVLTGAGQRSPHNAYSAGSLLGLRWVDVCWRRVEARERDQGFRYKYVHFQRPDLEWYGVHQHCAELLSAVQVRAASTDDRAAAQHGVVAVTQRLGRAAAGLRSPHTPSIPPPHTACARSGVSA